MDDDLSIDRGTRNVSAMSYSLVKEADDRSKSQANHRIAQWSLIEKFNMSPVPGDLAQVQT
jgi:hypothetical protein